MKKSLSNGVIIWLVLSSGILAFIDPFQTQMASAESLKDFAEAKNLLPAIEVSPNVFYFKGENYNLIEDYNTGEAKWISTETRLTDYLDVVTGYKYYADHIVVDNGSTIKIETLKSPSIVFDKNSCGYTLYNSGRITPDSQPVLPAISWIARSSVVGSGEWQYLDEVNNASCQTNVIQTPDGYQIEAIRAVLGDRIEPTYVELNDPTITSDTVTINGTSYPVTELSRETGFFLNGVYNDISLYTNNSTTTITDSDITFVNTVNGTSSTYDLVTFVENGYTFDQIVSGDVKFRTFHRIAMGDEIKESFIIENNDSNFDNHTFGATQTIHTGQTLTIGDNTFNIQQANGQRFDKDWIIENKGTIMEVADSIDYDFDVGLSILDSIFISYDNGVGKVSMDYDGYGGIVPVGTGISIDPSFSLTGTSPNTFDLTGLNLDTVALSSATFEGSALSSQDLTSLETAINNGDSTWTYSSAPSNDFVVTSGGNVEALVVAGGGAGGGSYGGGGGAGGLLYSASKSVTPQTYTITVGDGGHSQIFGTSQYAYYLAMSGENGGNSVFDTMTAIGGGGGRNYYSNIQNGGSGGGGSVYCTGAGSGTAGQGNNGADGATCNGGSPNWGAGGGGGAGGAGSGVNGGAGLQYSISGTAQYYAGGGGGARGNGSPTGSVGGSGVGGSGTVRSTDYTWTTGTNPDYYAGDPNTGSGGGGSEIPYSFQASTYYWYYCDVDGVPTPAKDKYNTNGSGDYLTGCFVANDPTAYMYATGRGGSGTVIISYPTGSISATGGTVTTSGSNTIHTFNYLHSSPTLTVNYVIATVPTAPTNLVATDGLPVGLSYSVPSDDGFGNSNGAELLGYKVYRADNPNAQLPLPDNGGTDSAGLDFTDNELLLNADTQYKVHTFTSSGTFSVTSGSGNIEYLVVGGGGGGGNDAFSNRWSGGGGAGGFRTNVVGAISGSNSVAEPSYSVTTQNYAITVGDGGAGGSGTGLTVAGSNGQSSSIVPTSGTSIISYGGGGGGAHMANPIDGSYYSGANPNGPVGSGGGADQFIGNDGAFGTIGQGYDGGQYGGSGAGGIGAFYTTNVASDYNGGVGLPSKISGTVQYYAGGGGGGNWNGGTWLGNSGNTGGAANDAGGGLAATTTGGNGGTNKGGGGGGTHAGTGGTGGSGIVIIRYVDDGSITATGGTVTTITETTIDNSPNTLAVTASSGSTTTGFIDNGISTPNLSVISSLLPDGTDSFTVGSWVKQVETRDPTLDGTNNGATTGQTGKVDSYAWSFDGLNDYITVGDTSSFSYINNPNQVSTVAFWYKSSTSPTSTFDAILGTVDGSATARGFEILRYQSSGAGVIVLTEGAGNKALNDYITNTGLFPVDNTWYHYVFVFDDVNSQLKIYKNNSLFQTISYTAWTPSTDSATQHQLNIARDIANSKYANLQLDQVLFYDDGLTTQEISDLYNSNSGTTTVPTSNLVAHYDFEQTGSTLENQIYSPPTNTKLLGFTNSDGDDVVFNVGTTTADFSKSAETFGSYTYSTDMSSSSDWTGLSGAFSYSVGQINYNADTSGSVAYVDLGDVSDTTFTLRAKVGVSTLSASSGSIQQLFIGLSDNTSTSSTAQDSISMLFRIDSYGSKIQRSWSNGGLMASNTANLSTSPTTTTYYFEIIRTGDSVTTNLRTGSHSGTLVGTNTFTVTDVTSLKYLKLATYAESSTNNFVGYIDDLSVSSEKYTTTFTPIISATGLTDNTSDFQHYALSRDGSSWTLYQNGASVATATDSTDLGSATTFGLGDAVIDTNTATGVGISGNTVFKTTVTGWTGGARSVEYVNTATGGGEMTCVLSNYGWTTAMCGFADSPSFGSNNYQSCDYCMYDGVVYENGVSSGSFSSPSQSSVAKVTIDGNGLVKYYVDGSLVYTSSNTATSNNYYATFMPNQYGVYGTLEIDKDIDLSHTINLDGSIDEYFIDSTALTSAEINNAYDRAGTFTFLTNPNQATYAQVPLPDNGGADTGSTGDEVDFTDNELLLHGESISSTTPDNSPNSLTVTANSGTTTTGQLSNAISTPNLEVTSSLLPDGTDNFTVGSWVKQTATPTNTKLFGFTNSNGDDVTFNLGTTTADFVYTTYSQPTTYSQLLDNDWTAMYSSAQKWGGIELQTANANGVGDYIDDISFWVYKFGSPTGNIYAYVLDSNNNVMATSTNYVDIATLGTASTGTKFTWTFDGTYQLQAGDKIVMEHATGNNQNYLLARISTTSTYDGTDTRFCLWQSGWNCIDSRDFKFTLNELAQANPTTIISATGLTDNTSDFQHYALTRDGSSWTLYQNGASVATATDSTDLGSTDSTATITSTGSYTQDYPVGSYDNNRQGAYIATTNSVLYGEEITSISFWLKKQGSPTGTAYVRAYSGSNSGTTYTVENEFGSIDVSTLTTSYQKYTFNTGSHIGALYDTIGIEWTGSSSANSPVILGSSSDVYDGANTGRGRTTAGSGGAWSPYTGHDIQFEVTTDGINPHTINIDGSIDEYFIDSTALSATEIQNIDDRGGVVYPYTTTSLTFNDNTVVGGEDYAYRVSALNDIGESTYSNIDSAMTVSPANAPTNLTATLTQNIEGSLNWTPSTDLGNGSLLKMRIERVTNGGAWNLVTETTSTSPPYVDTTISGGNTYIYRVASVNEAGTGDWSNNATLDTSCSVQQSYCGNAPSFSQALGKINQFILNWEIDNGTGVSGYRIENSSDGLTWSLYSQVPNQTISYTTATDFADNEQVYWRIWGEPFDEVNSLLAERTTADEVNNYTLNYPSKPLITNILLTGADAYHNNIFDIEFDNNTIPSGNWDFTGGDAITDFRLRVENIVNQSGWIDWVTNSSLVEQNGKYVFNSTELGTSETYNVQISVANDVDWSDWSDNYTRLTTYPPPTIVENFQSIPTNENQIDLIWKTVLDDGGSLTKDYEIRYLNNTNNDVMWSTLVTNSSLQYGADDYRYHNHTLINPAINFTYSVREGNYAGWSDWSMNMSAVTFEYITAILTAQESHSGDAINMNGTWTMTEGVDQYGITAISYEIINDTYPIRIVPLNITPTKGENVTIPLQYLLQLEPNLHNLKFRINLQNSTGVYAFDSPILSVTPAYQAQYVSSVEGNYQVNYTHDRNSAGTSLELVVNRPTAPFQVECNFKSELFEDGDWQNLTDLGYYNVSQNVKPTRNVYIQCYNDELLFTTVSYGQTNATLALTDFTDQLGSFFGVPLPFLFVIFLAAIFTGRSAPTGIIFLAASIGVMGVMGYFPDPTTGENMITATVWGMLILITGLGIFMGKRFF